ncbi:MAG: hypothetical protein CM1200mP25_0420 [Acidobacteriota bacterium]|nr:MAG: hypothetical protein CM1200mP25_0420 [Acidobacteriota bacterium]
MNHPWKSSMFSHTRFRPHFSSLFFGMLFRSHSFRKILSANPANRRTGWTSLISFSVMAVSAYAIRVWPRHQHRSMPLFGCTFLQVPFLLLGTLFIWSLDTVPDFPLRVPFQIASHIIMTLRAVVMGLCLAAVACQQPVTPTRVERTVFLRGTLAPLLLSRDGP